MNYRHAYHAGNFADVLKHAVLARVIEHLKLKPAPFRVIDTHAGRGLYDLTSEAARKTGEWRSGIARLLAGPPLPADVAEVLAPYLGVVRRLNAGGDITRYPGSPMLARRLMRPGDQLIANELHPEDGAELRRAMAGEDATKVMSLDGYVAVRALLPPKERRGLVLIDPPFEVSDEMDRLGAALGDVMKRFATGTLLVWYPIKDPRHAGGLHRIAAQLAPGKALVAELYIRAPDNSDLLNGCGLLLINPPFTLQGQLATLLPHLVQRLGQAKGARHRLDVLA